MNARSEANMATGNLLNDSCTNVYRKFNYANFAPSLHDKADVLG